MTKDLKTQMTCLAISEPGAPDVLAQQTRSIPEIRPGEVIIKVAAAGINYPDILQRQGRYAVPPGASDLPGLEVAGTIAAIGEGASKWQVGDKVCALVPGGGYATYCRAPAVQCLPVPNGLSMAEAATLPEVYFTIWFNLAMQGDLRTVKRILIHGGSGGIGSAAIQLAKALALTVFTTASGKRATAFCSELGADVVIDYKTQDFVDIITKATDGEGVDLVLDMVGGDYIQRNIACLGQKGRLVNLYYLQGSTVEVDMMPVLVKNLVLTGSLLRPQPLDVKARIGEELIANVWPLVESGRIRAVVDTVVDLEDAAAAHTKMEAGGLSGKLAMLTQYGRDLRDGS